MATFHWRRAGLEPERRLAHSIVGPWGRRGFLAYAVVLAVALVGLVVSFRAPGAVAQVDFRSFEAVAVADGVRYTVFAPGASVSDTVVEVGSPTAQSSVASLGGSTAFASVPYPGPLVVAAPPLVGGATGAPVPPYPLIAMSDQTNPESRVEAGTVILTASSDEQSSVGTALVGGGDDAGSSGAGRAQASAESVVDPASGTLTASAVSVSDVVEIAEVLRIGRVEGRSMVTRTASGELERVSSVTAADVTVAGVAARITDGGVVLAGAEAPLAPSNPLGEALAEAGVSARLVEPVELEDGIQSGAVVVTIERDVNGQFTEQTLTFGASLARVSATDGSPSPPTRAPLSTAPGAGGAPTGGGFAPTSPTPSPAGGGGAGGGSAAQPVAPVPAPVTEPAPAPEGEEVAVDAEPASLRMPGALSFYLVLVVGGLVALGGSQLIRYLGVKTAWIS